jgi:hypothetical protein
VPSPNVTLKHSHRFTESSSHVSALAVGDSDQVKTVQLKTVGSSVPFVIELPSGLRAGSVVSQYDRQSSQIADTDKELLKKKLLNPA